MADDSLYPIPDEFPYHGPVTKRIIYRGLPTAHASLPPPPHPPPPHPSSTLYNFSKNNSIFARRSKVGGKAGSWRDFQPRLLGGTLSSSPPSISYQFYARTDAPAAFPTSPTRNHSYSRSLEPLSPRHRLCRPHLIVLTPLSLAIFNKFHIPPSFLPSKTSIQKWIRIRE